ncbi:hypothetical protein HMPREF9072_00241 [Capnocytophaga sp. oral taxon 324 str. F0483]|nr:hypothetical protein HMPREF9072_00241 [Capnocytophaga sp. oral taxon 324 str. F0483]
MSIDKQLLRETLSISEGNRRNRKRAERIFGEKRVLGGWG